MGMPILFRELVHACRQARRTLLITVAGTTTLAIGIGVPFVLVGLAAAWGPARLAGRSAPAQALQAN
jgi:hypothetical protein